MEHIHMKKVAQNICQNFITSHRLTSQGGGKYEGDRGTQRKNTPHWGLESHIAERSFPKGENYCHAHASHMDHNEHLCAVNSSHCTISLISMPLHFKYEPAF